MNKIFYKYEGTGNDFILFEDYHLDFPIHPTLIQSLCNRKKGIGADGVLLLQPSPTSDVKMRIFNQDGSEASMCGNALRCTIKHLKKSCQIQTLSGTSIGRYSPLSIKATLPKSEIITQNIKITNNIQAHLVNTGTPHLVIFTDDFKEIEIAKKLRSDKRFGENGVNVNLAKVSKNGVFVRTFEKGVEEETESCGSGGGAVTLLLNQATTIFFPRHTLYFTIDEKSRLWMEGDVNQTFQGSFCVKRSELINSPIKI